MRLYLFFSLLLLSISDSIPLDDKATLYECDHIKLVNNYRLIFGDKNNSNNSLLKYFSKEIEEAYTKELSDGERFVSMYMKYALEAPIFIKEVTLIEQLVCQDIGQDGFLPKSICVRIRGLNKSNIESTVVLEFTNEKNRHSPQCKISYVSVSYGNITRGYRK